MSSLTNINNNSSVVNVGRTVPVSTGQKSADQSIPVVIADDQSPIPVVEQNKIQSEVALSLLGIPRSEVALGIFADVNTYDVNPSEWSSSPQTYIDGYGTKHSPTEAGAIVEAPRDKTAVLTSKRFFRYQPGRVSAATFGIKNSVALPDFEFAQNPVIKKYGIFDKYDGYYWETRQSGEGDNFTVVRRTQSLYKTPASPFGAIDDPAAPPKLRGYNAGTSDALTKAQTEDYRIAGTTPSAEIEESTLFVKERKSLAQARFSIADTAWTNAYTGQFKAVYDALTTADAKDTYQAKCKRDVDYWIDMYIMDLAAGGDAHTAINTKNYETSVAVKSQTAPHEITLHTAAKAAILDEFVTGSDDIKARLTELTNITINFFKDVDSDATNPYAVPTSYGNKTKLATMFDARRHYWAYYVSEYEYNADYPRTNGTAITYLPANDTADAEAIIKYKCQRDTLYIIDGYRDDLTGGGNGATKFNASMYYNNDSVHDKYTIYSQNTYNSNGSIAVIAEIARHIHLRIRIAADMADTYYGITDSTVKDKFYKAGDNTALTNIIVDNFSVENKANTVYGNTAVAGNLIVLRDGLIMVHAAVFDPGLLKEQIKVKAQLYNTDKVKLTEDHVTFGQHVKYFGATNGDLKDNTLYKVKTVYGPKGNEFSLVTEAGVAVNIANNTVGEFQLVNPFIFPTEYSSKVYNSTKEFTDGTFPKGMMFPYKYSENGELPLGNARGVGFIDTGISTGTQEGTDELSRQIDAVNFVPEYINWIKNNVKPEYYGVYEFRVPRSRFSTDQLNGQSNRVLYSDVASSEDGPVTPGQGVKNAVGLPLSYVSAYNFDFTKVSMLKIEFSWYGAVGALFLAYVPIGNGEARWVRVHHLRASNQLKISSLGNATLPITYSVYGGGSVNSLGDGDTTDNQGYGRASHNLVKYGASYYIDGGDRGTVRLYSHNNNEVTKVYGRKYALGTVALEFDTDIGLYYFVKPSNIPNSVFFMNAKITTSNRTDQNIKVAWVAGTKIYLSKAPSNISSNNPSIDITLTPDRANTVYGLETKREITSSDGFKVRNRVQVYPTKMSTANLGATPIRLRMKKTPLFQTAANPSITFNLTAPHTVTAENLELTTNTPTYLDDGESIYGWFRGTIGASSLTVFGKLYKISTSYYFEILENYNGIVTLSNGKFVHDLRFGPDGDNLATDVSKVIEEKEGISSVVIATDTQVPVAGTGIDVATLYLKAGTEQIDLSTYYDYNKEYLSYPLTDFADSLYLSVDTEDLASTTPSNLSISITWEEQ